MDSSGPPHPPSQPIWLLGWGGGGGIWILIQFLLRAITVSLQATQAAGYVCTENSAVGNSAVGGETGGGEGGSMPQSHMVPQTGSKTLQLQNLAFLKQTRGN